MTRDKKKLPTDTAWPPMGVRALKPDVPIRERADPMRFATLRDALERKEVQITPTPLQPITFTEEHVRDLLHSKSCGRTNAYLCRAYLQFGSEAMQTKDLQRLGIAIEKFNKKQTA